MEEETVFSSLNDIRQILFENRYKREAPSVDTKQITAWNSLMIKGLLVAAELLEYPKAADIALNALNFILYNNAKSDLILRTYQESGEYVKRDIEGVLPDYSFLISALIQAFEYTDNWEYMKIAEKIHSLTENKFYDKETSIYFLNSSSEETLLGRVVAISDDSMSSGLGVMVENLFKLGKYLMREDLIERGKKIAESFVERMNEFPGSMSTLLIGMTNYLRYPMELVIVNDEEGALNNAHNSIYIPHRLVYRWNKNNQQDGRPFWDVLEARDDTPVPTVFICEGMTCSLPLVNREDVIEELVKSHTSE